MFYYDFKYNKYQQILNLFGKKDIETTSILINQEMTHPLLSGKEITKEDKIVEAQS